MPLSHTTKLYAAADTKIAKVTADPAGGATTYAASVDVPGIKTLGIGGDIATAELRGDNTLLDYNATLTGMTVTVEHAKLSFDALAVLLGGTVADTAAVSPNQVTTFDVGSGTAFNYFRIEGKTPTNGGDATGGDIHFTLWKCILSGFPEMGLAEEDYQTISFECLALPRLSDGKWLTITANETAAVIA